MVDALEQQAQEVAERMKILSHPQRLLILCHLKDKNMNVTDLVESTGLSQSQTSQFLMRMTREGILNSKKVGKFVYYKVSDKRMIKIIKALSNIFS